MKRILIKDATIVNEGKVYKGSLLIEGEHIAEIYKERVPSEILDGITEIIHADGKYLFPGVIDDQVHFREPGLTHKGDIHTESGAAVAGGITSFMEMPNTLPQTITEGELNYKYERAAQTSFANYSFYLGATNDNLDILKKADPKRVCGIKVFMGSSTGNMLVDNPLMLERIFAEVPLMIATHCEKESIIKENIKHYTSLFGDDLPIKFHPLIRSEEACYQSSSEAVELALKHNTRLHILHLTTEKELSLFEDKPLEEKRITAEVCVPHLYFDDRDYERLGNRIKWNPAVKKESDRLALMQAVRTNRLDVIATDHAPHLFSEKEGSCLKAASGGPMVQHSLLAMLEKVKQQELTLEILVEKMCHAPAKLFKIENRGFIRKGYKADLVLVDPHQTFTVISANVLYKCGWSPFKGYTFSHKIDRTYVNGTLAYVNGTLNNECRGQELRFQ